MGEGEGGGGVVGMEEREGLAEALPPCDGVSGHTQPSNPQSRLTAI